MTYGLGLNLGTFYGNGVASISGTGYSGIYSNRVASNIVNQRITRDMASGYSQGFETLRSYLEEGDIDEALKEYKDLVEEVKESAQNYGYSLSDGQIASIVSGACQGTIGKSFTTAISENSSCPFVTGLKEGIPIFGLFANSHSQKEALAEANGKKTKAVHKVVEGLGAAVSGAVTGATAGAIAGCGVSSIPFAIAGAVIGGGVGIFNAIVKDIGKDII